MRKLKGWIYLGQAKEGGHIIFKCRYPVTEEFLMKSNVNSNPLPNKGRHSGKETSWSFSNDKTVKILGY